MKKYKITPFENKYLVILFTPELETILGNVQSELNSLQYKGDVIIDFLLLLKSSDSPKRFHICNFDGTNISEIQDYIPTESLITFTNFSFLSNPNLFKQ